MRVLSASAALLACLWAAPAAPAGPDTLVHAGRLLDRPGQAPRGASTLLIRNGRIEAVRDGFAAADAFPGAAVGTIIDLRDRFVLPGLIDCHVHLRDDRGGVAAVMAGVTHSVAARAYE